MLAHVLAFTGAALLLAMAPGPATAVLLRQTIRHGRRRGVSTLVGVEAGVLFWAVTAALGITALLAASEIAYTVLRVGGALVLVGMGVQAMARARHEHGDLAVAAASDDADQHPTRRAVRLGLVTNLANPKAGVFAVSFLPQFIPRHAPVLGTGLLLAVVWVVCDTTWYSCLIAVVHAARRVFSRAKVRRVFERISGVALVGFGVRLALLTR